MDNTFRIPGTLGPEITVGRSFFGNVGVLLDGQKATRRNSRTLTYLIPMSDARRPRWNSRVSGPA
jgi:hypothetical protein